MMMISFGYEESDKGVVDMGSCMGMQGVCGQVASEGKKRIGSVHSFPGNVPHGSMLNRMIL